MWLEVNKKWKSKLIFWFVLLSFRVGITSGRGYAHGEIGIAYIDIECVCGMTKRKKAFFVYLFIFEFLQVSIYVFCSQL